MQDLDGKAILRKPVMVP